MGMNPYLLEAPQPRLTASCWTQYLIALFCLGQMAVIVLTLAGVLSPAQGHLLGVNRADGMWQTWAFALGLALFMSFVIRPLVRRDREQALLAEIGTWQSTGDWPATVERRYRTTAQYRRDWGRMLSLGYLPNGDARRTFNGIVLTWHR